jgi:hypothetical protein
MDPCGPQKKIKSDSYHVAWQKLLDGGGKKSNYGFDVKGGKTKSVDSGEAYRQDQGKVRGKTTHIYGLNGRNDND